MISSYISKLKLIRPFCTFSAYDIEKGLIIFFNGRYTEVLKAAPSTNKKLKSTYKVELLDLFTNAVNKEYLSYGQIEKLDRVVTTKLEVEFQFFDEDRKLLILSDEVYNQHEVPIYLFRGHISSLQPGARFSLFLDGDRYIKMI
jgi:translation elongation factor P/translation initiation factor 5A